MVVVWRITEGCNLSCPFCGYDRGLSRPRKSAERTQVETFLNLLGRFRAESGESVLVSWLGGEPLLWQPLRALTRRGVDLGLSFSLTTNGTRLEEAETAAFVSEQLTELTVSVDGPAAVHDRLRGWPGGFATLRRSMLALARRRRESGRGPRRRANVVLMHDTWREFRALALELADWGVEEITFNALGGNDRPEFFPANRLTPADVAGLRELLPELRTRLAEHAVKLDGEPAYLRRLESSSRGEKMAVADCEPGQRFLFVDEQGRVAPCHFTADRYGVSVSELRTVADVRSLPLHFSTVRRRDRHPACDDCLSTQVWGKFRPARVVEPAFAEQDCGCRMNAEDRRR